MKKHILKKFILVTFFLAFALFSKNIAFASTSEHIIIRDGATIIYNDTVALPASGTISIPDNKGVEHTVDAQSVLGILYSLDQNTTSFTISDLSYNDTYKSFLLNCITPLSSSPACYNWQYVVNNSYPNVGMDKYILTGGETIYLFFGPQNRVLLSSNSITTNDTLTVTAQKYDYQNNTWAIRTGVTVGLTQPNPNDKWNPIDNIKLLVNDTTGIAIFHSIPKGSYDVGIKEDYYWPTEKLTVIKPPIITGAGTGVSASPFVNSTSSSSSSSGSSSSSSNSKNEVLVKELLAKKKTFSISKALNFLLTNQNTNGSFNSSMNTDWVAIASGVGKNKKLKTNLTNYLKNNPLDSSLPTDNERHAMALMALDINPYNGTNINYIKKIVNSFDGTQFGNSSLNNDDIFALIVLENAGYKGNNPMISKDIKYLISKQNKNGSWGNIDLTAATIQALRKFGNLPGVNGSISNATNYLITNQTTDGGFGNVFTTAWVLQSLPNNDKVLKSQNSLANDQQVDGGLEKDTTNLSTRILATAYAIPAILHKPWSIILNNFSKPATSTTSIILKNNNASSTLKSTSKLKEKVSVINKVKNKIIVQTKQIKRIKKIKTLEKKITKIIPKKIANINIKVPVSTKVILPKVNSNKNNHILFIISNTFSKIKSNISWLWYHLGF